MGLTNKGLAGNGNLAQQVIQQPSATEYHAEAHDASYNTSTGLSNRKLLMWAFLGSDVMFFGTFIATYLVYRNRSLVGPYPSDVLDIPLTTISTFVLLMSSLAMVLGLHYTREDSKFAARFWIFATAFLGLCFIGFQIYEFNHFVHLGLTPRTNLFGTTFFILTGFHGAHVTIGIVWLLVLLYGHFKGSLRSENSLDLEVAGLYWHFVDIVWIVIFTVLYLVTASDGAPPGAPPFISPH